MELRVLAVGDVVGDGGLQCLEQHLRSLKKLYRADFCVVNGENASGTGLTPQAGGPDAGRRVRTSSPSATTPSTAGRSARIWTTARISCGPPICGRACPAAAAAYLRRRSGRSALMNLLGRCNLDFRPDNPFLIDRTRSCRSWRRLPVLPGFPRRGDERKARPGLSAGREDRRPVGHAHACTDRRRADPAERHGLSDRSWHDGPGPLRHRREAGAVHRQLPRRADLPV